ncbi:MAG: RNA-binding protein [Candidatus Marinimicrobia bacterium]|jgi:RNA recognition motif-containing protein|nr:RNA-binding protein [Candidatus Neomarinimicrobiota bacterium]MBT3947112.1 RNA-binding protein [Candidatus Neomarinimicrobiota bacterium]MBT4065178.1 RNA-binding protein [Candidatus Neomarinimicrobiota bacterium]MBT4307510.1 RNA-binding protein [Candidatus Neomarinimicrobiota bacterium]MBT4736907.1 RNA-binding protein [Candidatus Neomarinimicrobiota bacterium]|tara:strand:+ start:229 stop:498 length:270 start_codon:yes stop_codon:yes gene_type:complete
MNIYVGNISFQLDESSLEAAFAEYGTVDSARIITDRATGRSKGFGFVEMADQAEGETAVQELNGKELEGRPLKVNEARPREERPSRPRY